MKWWRRPSQADIENLSAEFAQQFKGFDTDIVEIFSKKHNCIATVFVKSKDEYVRSATTLRQRDGTKAVGTVLHHTNPAYQNIQNGKSFSETINLYGVEYFTKYTPVFDEHNNIIGILFVGLRRRTYREARAFQICLVFSVSIFALLFAHNSHVAWMGFTVMLIYVGFDKGASLQRTRERLLGVIAGLFIGYFIWLFGQIDYRLIILITPLLVFLTFYFVGKNFIFQSAFIVALSVLGSDFYKSTNSTAVNFLFEYLVFTMAAFAICIIFDYLVFNKVNLSRKFYFDLQDKIILNLNRLFLIVCEEPMRRSHYLKQSNQLNAGILELYTFIGATKYDIQNQSLESESNEFREKIQQIYHNIRRLFLRSKMENDQLISETRQLLEELSRSVYST